MADGSGSRLDRELSELLQELRIVLPGVQVIFAFLLTVPFAARFPDLGGVGRALYVVALTGAAVSSVLLIAPTTLHRVRWRERDKEWMMRLSNRLALAGTATLAVTLATALHLVTSFMYGWRLAVGLSTAVFVGLILLWYVVPAWRRIDDA